MSPQEKTEYLESLFDLEVMIGELKELSRNLWWTWNPDAQEIFAELSRLVWNASRHNAVAVLGSVSKAELKSRLMDRDFAARTREVLAAFREYLTRERTWCSAHAAPFLKNPVAYFCAEFALHESLPLYCGGLGVLAGDHAKSASDLGVPFIGITLFYRQGYFEQLISHGGWQEEHYPSLDRHNLPLEPVLDSQGRPLLLWVEFSQSRIWFQAWRLRVGCTAIYLLDTELPQNDSAYRGLTSRVYGGDMTTRIGQEMVMGIGGVRLLQALGVTPAVYHLNEGHSAFLVLELLRQQLDSGSGLQAAETWVRDRCVFTTHTPVAAGHDRFSPELMEYAFAGYRSLLGMEAPQFLSYGRTRPDDPNEFFCMTVLALKMSREANGVSQLHGQVSREIWKELLDSPAYRGSSIGHITNGVHVLGWMARPIRRFWKQHLGPEWETRLMSPDLWRVISEEETITDEEIWALRYHLRRELIEFVRKHVPDTFPASGTERARGFEALLSPDALTIGFARRFATYKRAPLIFSDLPRITEMLNDPQRPVQLIFSGKAHPQEYPGKGIHPAHPRHQQTKRIPGQGGLPGELRHERGPSHDLRRRPLAQYASPPPGGQRHQRPEGECARGIESERPGRLVEGRLRRHQWVGHRGGYAPGRPSRPGPGRPGVTLPGPEPEHHPAVFRPGLSGNPPGLDCEDPPGHANPDPAIQHGPHGDRVRHPLLPAQEVTPSGAGSVAASYGESAIERSYFSAPSSAQRQSMN